MLKINTCLIHTLDCIADHEAEELASCNTEKDKGEHKSATTLCGPVVVQLDYK
jgi:hypothetical protein